MAGLNIIASEGTTVRISDDGGAAFKELPGIQSHSESGGDLNQRQVKAFKGVASKLSLPDVSTISVTALYTPTHPAWLMLNAAARAGKLLVWEVYTAVEDIFSKGDEAAHLTIDVSTGIATFAKGAPDLLSDDYGVGMTLETQEGNAATQRAYTIEEILTKNTAKLEQNAAGDGVIYYTSAGVRTEVKADVTLAKAYKIRTPEEYLRYTARSGKPPASLENEADMQTSFTVYPRTLLGDWLVRAKAV